MRGVEDEDARPGEIGVRRRQRRLHMANRHVGASMRGLTSRTSAKSRTRRSRHSARTHRTTRRVNRSPVPPMDSVRSGRASSRCCSPPRSRLTYAVSPRRCRRSLPGRPDVAVQAATTSVVRRDRKGGHASGPPRRPCGMVRENPFGTGVTGQRRQGGRGCPPRPCWPVASGSSPARSPPAGIDHASGARRRRWPLATGARAPGRSCHQARGAGDHAASGAPGARDRRGVRRGRRRRVPIFGHGCTWRDAFQDEVDGRVGEQRRWQVSLLLGGVRRGVLPSADSRRRSRHLPPWRQRVGDDALGLDAGMGTGAAGRPTRARSRRWMLSIRE